MTRDRDHQRRLAEVFLDLHLRPPLLLLANAWDVISARIFETAGFRAIGTTSAGIAAALGYPDGQHMSLRETIEVTRRIVSCTGLPVSADLEAGYSPTVEGVVAAARAALDAGVVGINLEDGSCDGHCTLLPVTEQTRRIAAIREMAAEEEVHLVINARTDACLAQGNDAAAGVAEAIARGRAYLQAGADCVFVPDPENLDPTSMQELVDGIPGPVNLIAGRNTPPVSQLEAIGVARVSFGPRPMRVALGAIRRFANEAMLKGTFDSLTGDSLTYAEVNEMLAARGTRH